MNHIYRLVWNYRTQTLVPVAETTRSQGKQGGRTVALGTAIVGALAAMTSVQALAANNCGPGSASVTVQPGNECSLTVGQTLTGSAGSTVVGYPASQSYTFFNNAGEMNGLGTSSGGPVLRINNSVTFSGGITNSGSLQISGNATGIKVGNSVLMQGLFANSGVISSPSYALLLGSATLLTSGLENSGVISGKRSIMLDGATVVGGIRNIAGGTLTGSVNQLNAFYLMNASVSGGLTNAGLVQNYGTNVGISGAAIYMQAGQLDALTNQVGGDISGGSGPSIFLYKATGAANIGMITNDGTVRSDTGAGVQVFGLGGSPLVGNGPSIGGLSNAGVISGVNAIAFGNNPYYPQYITYGSSEIGFISNTGTIEGLPGNNASAILITKGYTLSGDLVNDVNGTVTSNQGARDIFLNSGAKLVGGITNAGNILANGSVEAIRLENGVLTGVLTNSGLIQSQGGDAIGLKYATSRFDGGIINSGTVSGPAGAAALMLARGASVAAGLGGGVNNDGTVSGGVAGIKMVSAGAINGGITNSGLIQNTSTPGNLIDYAAILMQDGGLATGDIVNQPNGRIVGAGQGISLYTHSTISGNINNFGTIFGLAPHGAGIQVQATPSGGQPSDASTLIGAITNQSGAKISGFGYGIRAYKNSSVTNGITNGGLISGSTQYGVGLEQNSTLSGGVVNQGTILGHVAGLWLGTSVINGGVINQGSISGGAYGGLRVSTSATLSGGITNSGILTSSTSSGLLVAYGSSISGGITNLALATISGVTGIDVGSSDVIQGGLSNSGLIIGSTKSIDLSNTASGFIVDNASTLSGAANIGINTLNLNGSSARVIGDTTATTGDVTVNGTFTSEGTFGVDQFVVANGSTFTQAHAITATSGVNVAAGGRLDVVGTVIGNITGDYTQAGTLAISASGQYPGSLNPGSGHGGLSVSGNVTVGGTIDADITANYCNSLQAGDTITGVIYTPGQSYSVVGSITVNDNCARAVFAAAVNYNYLDLVVQSVIAPPSAPTSVSGTAGPSSAIISFSPPSSTGGASITGYGATCTSTNGGAPGSVTGSSSPLTVNGLTAGKTYTCDVTASNSQGAGAASSTGSIIPLGVPDAPTAVSATAGNGQAVVTFTAPTNTGGSTITGYSASCTSSNGGAAGTITGSSSPLTVTGLTNGKTYTCAITATNAQGTGSASTASSPIIPLGVPDAPTAVIATPGNAQVSLSWTAPTNTGGQPITGYTVTGAPVGSCTTTGATSCVITGLTNGTAYTFQVVATTAQGDSAAASSNTVTPEAATAPVIFAVSPSTGPQAGGTAVIITGTNLTGATQVLFGGTPATGVTVNQAGNQITAITPAHAGGAIDITVVTPAGDDVLEMSFTYDAPPAIPGTPIPAAGDRQVNVSWPQVLTGGDPVSYTVTATPGGQTCTVPFPGQAYPYASCIVTGLTNGTAYTFRVQATNALGNATSGSSIAATPAAVLNGACGAASGVPTLVPPVGLLCGTGTASAVSNANGTFTWDCTGTNGGSTAQCSAPGAASQGSQTGSTAFTTDTASNGCNLQSARLLTPPDGGPGGSTTMPYGVVNFEMVSCSGNEARVRMTYAGIVEGMQFWKYVVNSYHTGWTQLPSNEVTLSGNTAEFTIVDNGEWDNDPTVGAIADPGGPGFDPNALTPPGQPTNVTGTAGNQSATLRWDVPASGGQPVRYIVAALINGVPTGQTCEATWPATSCTVQGLTNGQAYTFTVTAENGAGVGQAGVVVTPVTPRPNPAPPPNPIPVLGPVGLVGLSSLLAGIGGWRQRRRAQADRKAN